MDDDLSSFLRAIPLPSVMVSSNERIVNVNEPAKAVFGEKFLHHHYITVFRQPGILDAIETCLRDHTPQQAQFLLQEAGRDVTLEAHIGSVEFGTFSGAVITFQDVSERQEAGQMRRDFVANVSHELRTPLTALLGFIETLRGPARKDEAARDRFLGIMQDEAARMNRLVQDLLSLSRVESEERMRPSEPLELVGQMKSVARLLQPMAEKAGVAIELDLPGHDVQIVGDGDQIAQVLTNLIENAIKYGSSGKRVLIGLSLATFDSDLRGPAARIKVQDFGPGIDPLHLPRLTERFYRVDTHRSRNLGGTGLGLAIVKHIINRHRGRMRVESELGKGTMFTVKLPM
ncbi:two-component system, OmpR family, phosphate regulon sensor histidine kinase PhoR [Poseidonocella pacifica]|uniref:histidine kinase n=1 Tax=Poseidonocella pacifica TaxID=871651 RepID=A0A1I0VMJ8_9RHOB|nr:ATP-binding protein [Poseidonocella pacifica]SFA77458.1 two-component system, OmpR family, phosphate regulon sensor histidine kinase PhoR [Poseidonocella pacifica]